MTTETMIGVVAGGVIGWLTSLWFYRKGNVSAAAAADVIVKAQQEGFNILARRLDAAKMGEATYDDAGNVVGMKLHARAHFVSQATMTARPSNLPPPPPPVYDRQHENPETPTRPTE